jgi:hypothetical protein
LVYAPPRYKKDEKSYRIDIRGFAVSSSCEFACLMLLLF